jgi:ribonuclease HI
MPDTEHAILYTDGSSLGNPGPAGAGFVLYTSDRSLVADGSIPLGSTTNNQAEYRALIAGLHEASARGIKHLTVRSDSELLCRQLSGTYRVRSESLRKLHAWSRRLLKRFESAAVEHVPRSQNTEADRLAQQASRRAKAADVQKP